MFKFIILFLCIFTISCMQQPKTRDASNEYVIPLELQDCLFIKMTDTYGSNVTVIRCPYSSTTTTVNDKTPQRSVVIDGVEYVNKDILKEEIQNVPVYNQGQVQRDMSQQRQE